VPDRPWRWGILVVILQPVILILESESSPYTGIGIIFFIFFMLIATGCAYLGKALRRMTRAGTK
jgi:hypothetical protein